MTTPTNKHRFRVLQGPVGKTLVEMTIPMVLGIVAVLLISVVDTYWVGHLGAEELAAISFTFPISYVIFSVLMGLGVGLSTAVSHAVGANNEEEAQNLVSKGLVLAVLSIAFLSVLGIAIIDPLFTLMGATGEVLYEIRRYLIVWYGGVVLLAPPMVGNGAIRGLGDSVTPGVVMFTSAVINAIAAPILIFGYGPIPPFGIQGAALSSIIAWAGSLFLVLYILTKKLKIFRFSLCLHNDYLNTWRKILHVGAPAAGANLIQPIAAAIITALIARFGNEAVAGFGVGSRIEPLALVVVMGLGSVLSPFMGQNWGASQYLRARRALRLSLRFSLFCMGGVFLFLYFGRFSVAYFFTMEEGVVSTLLAYLTIVPISYGGYAITIIACSALNAVRRPLHSFALSLIRLFVLLVPLAYIGGKMTGITGVFVGMSIANILSGGIAWSLTRKIVQNAQREEEEAIA